MFIIFTSNKNSVASIFFICIREYNTMQLPQHFILSNLKDLTDLKNSFLFSSLRFILEMNELNTV